jgi:quercetin dioxygenase-like cupin family protein
VTAGDIHVDLDASPSAVQRVVTVTNPDGIAGIESDRVVRPVGPPELPSGIEVSIVWAVEDSPARPEQGESREWRIGSVPNEGARWTMTTIRPGADVRGLHKTDTVDLVHIVEGEIWLVMEDGSERMVRKGDCVVQRATVHTWANRSDAPCTMSVVFLSTLPKGSGGGH